MNIQNNTGVDYWFGPIHLPANTTITVDDITDTSLYLTDDAVADAINTLSETSPAVITVTGAAPGFPRATGTPTVLHGDGSPQGLVYGPQGSLYLRRDSTVPSTSIYVKNTGVTENVGWAALGTALTAITGSVSASGSVLAGSGYTVSHTASSGIYTISFNTAQSTTPLILVTPTGTSSYVWVFVQTYSISTTGFSLVTGVWTYGGAGSNANPTDTPFDFLSIIPI